MREKVNRGYMSWVCAWRCSPWTIVEAILDGRQPAELRLDDLLAGFPLEWERAAATGRLAAETS